MFDEIERHRAEIMEKLSNLEAKIRSFEEEGLKIGKTSEIAGLLSETRKLRLELKRIKLEAKRGFKGFLTNVESLKNNIQDDVLLEELKDYIDDVLDEVETRIEDLEDRADDLVERLRDVLRERRKQGGLAMASLSFTEPAKLNVLRGDFKVIDEALREVDRIIREAFSGLWSRTPTTIISSVRLPQSDLNVIDLLVEAGIFKSRNEGIAFFVHKGIESSKEWLDKVRSKVEEIKRLQEETRKELERLLDVEEKPDAKTQ
jgi:Arc/MetJ-type ribon-helix-helix transcriptional regulator/gas vesicle protein